ncbi:hypothetical protein [Rhodanobacter sp. FW106-PBR-LB-2-11]|uniref:hypothetical protein n=1 Tax=Rhodanobacter sp. FW106-PBR-LB-2-11 TaxID=1524463 RepID=UPI0034E3FEBB
MNGLLFLLVVVVFAKGVLSFIPKAPEEKDERMEMLRDSIKSKQLQEQEATNPPSQEVNIWELIRQSEIEDALDAAREAAAVKAAKGASTAKAESKRSVVTVTVDPVISGRPITSSVQMAEKVEARFGKVIGVRTKDGVVHLRAQQDDQGNLVLPDWVVSPEPPVEEAVAIHREECLEPWEIEDLIAQQMAAPQGDLFGATDTIH